MGGCGSREKELREKVGFSQSDFDYATKKFSKMTKIKPGKSEEYFSFEGFKQYFTENPVLAQKLYIFMRAQGGESYIDLPTFLQIIDLFSRVSMKMQGPLKNLDIHVILILVSLSSPDILQRNQFNHNNAYKISVNYSNAVKLFKELINMQSAKGEILCHDDDSAPMLIINSIFENHSSLNYKAFIDKIKEQAPLMSKIIKNYIAGKFINKQLRNTLPKLEPSQLMNRQLIALMNLTVPWFYKCDQINIIYKYENEGDSNYNFNVLANSLLSAKGPIVILFRNSKQDGEKVERHSFGYFTSSQWRLSPDISGNKNSFVFSINPKFKIYSTIGQQQSKFALLIPIITKRSSQQLASPLKAGPKTPGLGIGGSGYEQHRIWIDGKQLQASRIMEEDKTFQSGPLVPNSSHLLNIDLIEIWQLQMSTVGQSTSYFRSTNHINYYGEDEKKINQNHLRDVIVTLNQQQGRNDYRRATHEFQYSNPLLPINEEEEEKQNAK